MKPNLTGALLMTAAVFSATYFGLAPLRADETTDAPQTIRCTFQPFVRPEILTDHLNLGGKNPDGGEIGVNSLYLIRDGKPWIPVMGEMHFSRVPREQWPVELAKLKAGGVNIVSTYLFWIHHEEVEGELSFSGNLSIRDFVLEAKKQGLEVFIRPGPWVHGESRNGGFPDWLMKKPFRLRSNNDGYLAEVRRWYGAIGKELRGLFYSDGGPIIGVQLENELTGNAAHLDTLRTIAIESGMNPPLFTVTGWNAAEGARIPLTGVLPVFGGYCDAPWNSGTRPLPPSPHFFFNRMRNDTAIGADLLPTNRTGRDGWRLPYERYPFASCELGGGLESTHHRRYIIRPYDVYAPVLVKIGSGCNLPGYYMYHGGTNPVGKLSTFQESKASGYPNDVPILSYDFQAPVSEYGEIRPSYRLLNLMHLFLQDFGDKLAPMPAFDSMIPVKRDDTTTVRAGLRTDGKSGFVFVNHYQRRSNLADLENVVFDTGSVVFPAIDIVGDIAFFLPFNMDLGGEMLEYATAQPVCRMGDTFFFAAIPGVMTEYKFTDGTRESGPIFQHGKVRIHTLPWKDALGLRRLGGELYSSRDCDLIRVEGDDPVVRPAQSGAYDARKWNGEKFTVFRVGTRTARPVLRATQMNQAPFEIPEMFAAELKLSGASQILPLTWWKLEAYGDPNGFVEFHEVYDVAQIYADGKFVADQYDCGFPWRIPASLLIGKECYLVMSPRTGNVYREDEAEPQLR